MMQINQITSDPLQQQILLLPDGNTLSLTLYFSSMQQCWLIQNLTYNTFILNNYKIVISPNMLYQYTNIIPFGLACFSTNNREPQLQQDFSSGQANLYILSADEVVQVREYIQSGNSA